MFFFFFFLNYFIKIIYADGLDINVENSVDEFNQYMIEMLDKIRREDIFRDCPILFAIEANNQFVADTIVAKISTYRTLNQKLDQNLYFMKESGNFKNDRRFGVPKSNDITIASKIKLNYYISTKTVGFRVNHKGQYNFYTSNKTNNCMKIINMVKLAMDNFIYEKTKKSIRIHGKKGGENDDVVVVLMMLYWMEIFFTSPYYSELLDSIEI